MTAEYPWAVENRVVREPIIALFRNRDEADSYVDDTIDLRVIPAPGTEPDDRPVTVLEVVAELLAKLPERPLLERASDREVALGNYERDQLDEHVRQLAIGEAQKLIRDVEQNATRLEREAKLARGRAYVITEAVRRELSWAR